MNERLHGERRRGPKPLAGEALDWYAVKALAARARSIGELRRLLNRRAAKPEEVSGVLARLQEQGYLNDARFAETFAAARLENDRLGRVRVVRDLRARHVTPEVAERAARKAFDGVDELALLRSRLEARLRRSGPPSTERKLASLYRALRLAGFPHAMVLDELRRLKVETEPLEALDETAGDVSG